MTKAEKKNCKNCEFGLQAAAEACAEARRSDSRSLGTGRAASERRSGYVRCGRNSVALIPALKSRSISCAVGRGVRRDTVVQSAHLCFGGKFRGGADVIFCFRRTQFGVWLGEPHAGPTSCTRSQIRSTSPRQKFAGEGTSRRLLLTLKDV